MRAKFGGLAMPSGVESYTRLFSSDSSCEAERPGRERGHESNNRRLGGGRGGLGVSCCRQLRVGTS